MASRKVYLWLEFVSLFALIPLLLSFGYLPKWPVPFLIAVAMFAAYQLHQSNVFPNEWFTNWRDGRMHLPDVLLRTSLLVVLIGVAVWAWKPELLFSYVKQGPWLWLGLMIAYPILSVYPQELIFRAFFFHRYRPLFETQGMLIAASAVAFGFVHVIFGNWISVVLSTAGGVLFSVTYLRSRSLLLTSLEHALFGNFIFTIGLGQYFHHAGPLLGR